MNSLTAFAVATGVRPLLLNHRAVAILARLALGLERLPLGGHRLPLRSDGLVRVPSAVRGRARQPPPITIPHRRGFGPARADRLPRADDDASDEHDEHGRDARRPAPCAAARTSAADSARSAAARRSARRAGSADVRRQLRRRRVAARLVLLERLGDDRLDVAAERRSIELSRVGSSSRIVGTASGSRLLMSYGSRPASSS